MAEEFQIFSRHTAALRLLVIFVASLVNVSPLLLVTFVPRKQTVEST